MARNLRKQGDRMVKSVKNAVHQRDEMKCRKCGRCAQAGREEILHAHHITAYMDGGECTPDNLVTLCESCHKEWHFAEKVTTIPFSTWLQAPPYLALFVGWQHSDDRSAISAASQMYYSLPGPEARA